MKRELLAKESKIHGTKLESPIYLKAEVQFGSPSNKCKGVGICRVTTLSKFVSSQVAGNRAFALVHADNKILQFKFLKSSLTPLMLQIYFYDRKFVITDDFLFTSTFLKCLRYNHNTIKAGVYKVKETNQFLTVTFIESNSRTSVPFSA